MEQRYGMHIDWLMTIINSEYDDMQCLLSPDAFQRNQVSFLLIRIDL